MPEKPESLPPIPPLPPLPGEQPPAAPPPDTRDIADLVRSLGQVINNMYLYTAGHKVTRRSMDKSYESLGKALEARESVNFSVVDKNVLVDGQQVDTKNPLVAAFVKQLVALEIAGFSMNRGMTREEFDKLMDLLNTRPDKMKEMGSFSKAVASVGLDHVQAKTVTYQMVTEEDIVVRKGELEHALAGAGGAGAKGLEEIIAFLKGGPVTDESTVAENVREIASDAEKLADLIVRAAQVEKEAQPLEGGESLADLLVGCLRRTYETLLDDPSAKSLQGKKNLTRTLMVLEKNIRDKLHGIPDAGEDADSKVTEAVEEMAIELTIDALAAEYAKKRKGIETAEKKILSFLKVKGGEDAEATTELKEKLTESGLSSEDWRELVVKSHSSGRKAEGAGAGGGAGMPGVGMLATLLTQLGEVLKPAEPAAPAGAGAGGGPGAQAVTAEQEQKLTQVLVQVNQEVTDLTARTESKIDALVRQIQEADAMGKGVKPTISRQALITMLAEIVQELLQPLAVINCSVEMIRMKRLGEVTQSQNEMLDLAMSSIDRIQKLADKLMSISGVPRGLTPDQGMIGTFYQ